MLSFLLFTGRFHRPFCTIVWMIMTLNVFSCVGFEVLTCNPLNETDEDFAVLIDRYFPNIAITMLTLLQLVFLDSIGAIYKPLIEKQSILVFYFAAVLLIGPIVPMNLVTAVIVNGAVEQAESDRVSSNLSVTKREKEVVKDLRMIFHQLDTDGSSSVSLEEVLAMNSRARKSSTAWHTFQTLQRSSMPWMLTRVGS